MLGAIAGDVIGSYYEHFPTKSRKFYLFRDESEFTDDTVLTCAVAECLLTGRDLVTLLQDYCRRYPDAGYGAAFLTWVRTGGREPYGSWGNGSAMRVSPVGWVANHLDEAIELATRSASVTHNHPDGIRGAVAVAGSILLARQRATRDDIRAFVSGHCGYELTHMLGEIRDRYSFDVSCSGSVPESLLAFLESVDFESAIRNAVSLGGDADTMACIAGAIAEAFYGGVPKEIEMETLSRLDPDIRQVVGAFQERFVRPVR